VVALKTLIVSHRTSLYYSKFNSQALEQLYDGVFRRWSEIWQQKVKNLNDQFRCEFFGKLICLYAEALREKSRLVAEFSPFMSSEYSLAPYFQKCPSGSPLQVKLLSGLNKLWHMMLKCGNKLFQKPLYLWEIRVSIVVNLLEDQYALLSLATHLFFTFKTAF